ncbi:MAG: hypothetical protein WBV94_33295 [Blastocatellia bacterium]
MKPYGFAPLSRTLPYWPSDIFGQPEFLEEIGVRDFEVQGADDQLSMIGTLIWVREISFDLPLINGFSVALLSGNGFTAVPFEIDILPEFVIRIPDISIAFRLDTKLLRPVQQVNQKWVPINDTDGKPKPAELRFTGIGVQVDLDGNLELLIPSGAPMGSLGAVQIGNTGIVVELEGLAPYFSVKQTPPAGAPSGFRGVKIDSLKVYLPDDFNIPAAPGNLHAENLLLGTGGFSGTIGATWTSNFANGQYTGNGAGTLFGIPFGLKSLNVTFKQNVPTALAIQGEMLLPFFDEPVRVSIGMGSNGNLIVSLDSATANGLYKLTKKNILELELDSIGFEVKGGLFTAKLSGEITPLVAGLNWPSFRIKELAIDSEGHVRLDGGWLDLPDQYALDFHGFKIEITQLGFGKTEAGGKEGKWIGFSGGLKLVDGFPAGASVEGLRLTWYPDGTTRITLNGVGVEFEVPEVVRFKGAVSYRELEVTTPTGDIETVHRFDGDIELHLISLNLKIDATLVIGSASGEDGTYTFFAIYVNVELPTGIPLASTGVALYGFAGLFALQMEPDKHADEEWYDGWFKRPDIGVTDLRHKWVNRRDSLAFGAGVTLGTQSDNGFTFSGRMLLAIIFPGPIVLIEGKANLLKERAKLDKEEPTFRSLAVIDNREKTFLIGLDAFYKNDATAGKLIDIRAGTEAFFDFKDASRWHIYVGEREPRNKRIRAEIFRLFEANSYFMLDAHQLATGAWLGYSRGFQFGPLKVSLEAWIEGNAVISWKPVHFYGALWMHGSVELSVFGFGLGLSADARFAADVFDPFHVLGELSVGIKIPLRKKRLEANLKFEWGPSLDRPPLPLPLKEISIEHFKVTTTWPLERGLLLLPNYDRGDGFIDDSTVNNQENADPPLNIPVVPMDCRPHISFGRTVHDAALVGVNAQPVVPPWEQIGDPEKNEGPVSIRYSLNEIALSKWTSPGWQLIARKSTNANPVGIRTLFGSWAPTPGLPAGNVTPGTDPPVSNSKLWLWSLTPFDYTRHSGNDFNDWFIENFTHYPCIPELSDREICCNFERIGPMRQIRSPLQCVDHPEISIEWLAGIFTSVTMLKQPIMGLTHAWCFPRVAFRPSDSDLFELIGSEDLGASDEAAHDKTISGEIPSDEIGSGLIIDNTVAIKLSEPAVRVMIVVTQEHVTPPTNVRFRDTPPDKGPNPRNVRKVQFEARDANGRPLNATRINAVATIQGSMTGLNCEHELEIAFPCTSAFVQLTLTHSTDVQSPGLPASAITISAFNEDGTIAAVRNLQSPEHTLETIRLTGTAIKRVVIGTVGIQGSGIEVSDATVIPPFNQEVWLHELWYDCSGVASIRATGFDDQRNTYGPFIAVDNLIEVVGQNINLVLVQSSGEICLLQVCATLPPDPAEVDERDNMAQHLIDEMARWSEEGEVLEPDTTYRLKVITSVETTDPKNKQLTEYAYFRTGGPPGLTKLTPGGPGASEELDSGLNDLDRYVRQTTPATVPDIGDKPVMAKPFYRAYDIGVEFNESYVDLMYKMAGRDLGLYLYDNNNRAARDIEGRLIIANNAWGTTEELTLTESDALWINLANTRLCDPAGSIVANTIPHNKTLTSGAEGQVLDGDTLYEARLIPLLLHEIFTDYAVGANANGPTGRLDRWEVFDSGSNDGPSHWEVREEGTPPGRYIIQTSNIWGGTDDGNDPNKPGTVLFRTRYRDLPVDHADQPFNWTDYRLSAYLRSASDRAVGLVFRYLDADHFYRFSMDSQGPYRRLVSVINGEHTILAEDDFSYELNHDYQITIEVIGSSLRVYQDEDLVFDVNNASIEHGSAGLYCWRNTGARFSDVRIDDFRKQAPTVYSFKFTTSLFTDFFHHLHSFQDETWIMELESLAGVQPLVAQAVSPATPPSEAEARAYGALADLVLGPSALQNPPRVEVTRVEHGGEALVLLVQSPEPIDWKRAGLEVLHTGHSAPKPALPGAVKLTNVTLGATQPNEESVTLLLREATDLTDYRIEYLDLPGVMGPIGDDQPVLLRDHFVDDDTTDWTIVDEGTVEGPSIWGTSEGEFRQTSNINTKPLIRAVLSKLGTQAIAGALDWTDVIVSAELRSVNDDGAIGIVFRHENETNYYRFSMDSQQAYRRLVKNVGGTFTLLWEDDFAYEVGRAYRVAIVAIGSTLRGYLDGARMFEIEDADLAAGQVGLYCFRNTDARFSEVRVAASMWAPYYSFGQESRMPTGTRVRVYAGNEADAPAGEQGVARRFIASGSDHGQLRLPADGAGLRLRAPDGAEGHARRFLADADYVPEAATQVLRKADGTGFFVIVPSGTQAGSALAVGQYRLSMIYRRNNQAMDPGGQVLSEAGNKSDERATIDIPW